MSIEKFSNHTSEVEFIGHITGLERRLRKNTIVTEKKPGTYLDEFVVAVMTEETNEAASKKIHEVVCCVSVRDQR